MFCPKEREEDLDDAHGLNDLEHELDAVISRLFAVLDLGLTRVGEEVGDEGLHDPHSGTEEAVVAHVEVQQIRDH